MLSRGKHPARQEVLDLLGPSIHIVDGGAKDPIPYNKEDM